MEANVDVFCNGIIQTANAYTPEGGIGTGTVKSDCEFIIRSLNLISRECVASIRFREHAFRQGSRIKNIIVRVGVGITDVHIENVEGPLVFRQVLRHRQHLDLNRNDLFKAAGRGHSNVQIDDSLFRNSRQIPEHKGNFSAAVVASLKRQILNDRTALFIRKGDSPLDIGILVFHNVTQMQRTKLVLFFGRIACIMNKVVQVGLYAGGFICLNGRYNAH